MSVLMPATVLKMKSKCSLRKAKWCIECALFSKAGGFDLCIGR